jgi:hypothetical protein
MQQHMFATVIAVVLIAIVGMVMVGNLSHQTGFVASESIVTPTPTTPTATTGTDTTGSIEPLPGTVQCPKMTDTVSFYRGKGNNPGTDNAAKLAAATAAVADCATHKQSAITEQEAEHNNNKSTCEAANCVFSPATYEATVPNGDKGCEPISATLVLLPGPSDDDVKIMINYTVTGVTMNGSTVQSVTLNPTDAAQAPRSKVGWTFTAQGRLDYDNYKCEAKGTVANS